MHFSLGLNNSVKYKMQLFNVTLSSNWLKHKKESSSTIVSYRAIQIMQKKYSIVQCMNFSLFFINCVFIIYIYICLHFLFFSNYYATLDSIDYLPYYFDEITFNSKFTVLPFYTVFPGLSQSAREFNDSLHKTVSFLMLLSQKCQRRNVCRNKIIRRFIIL